MASFNSQVVQESEEEEEEECEMVAIPLSTPPPQTTTINKDDDKSQAENKISLKLKENLVATKRIIEEKFLQGFGFSGTSDRTIRVYQVWQGNNVFFFHGRLVCGPDPRGLLMTTISIVLSSWIFAVYTAENFPSHRLRLVVVVFSVILTVIVLVNLFLVSSIDPGIIPRNDQEPVEEISTNGRIRRKRVTVNGVELKLRYCHICKMFRPPRTCHCAICNNCVNRFDHHCPWIGQCIALRNYRFFLAFISSALVFFVYIFVFSCWGINRRMYKSSIGLLGIVTNCPETLALISFSFVAICFSGGLATFHAFLIAINQTAYENYRQSYKSCQNPFDKGILGNIKEIVFSPIPPPKVDFRAQLMDSWEETIPQV